MRLKTRYQYLMTDSYLPEKILVPTLHVHSTVATPDIPATNDYRLGYLLLVAGLSISPFSGSGR